MIRTAPAGLPLVGDLPAYLRDRLAFFSARGNGAGAVVRCRLAGDGYLLNEPEDIRHVLVRNQPNYVKSRRLAGSRPEYPPPYSLLTSAGADHRRRRRAIQRIYRQPLVDGLVERSRANTERLTSSWAGGAEIDVGDAMARLAQRNILETLFGSGSEAPLEGLAAASRARRRFFERVFVSILPHPEHLPTRANLGYARATRRLDAWIEAEIHARRRTRRRPPDMLSMLMDVTYDGGGGLNDRELRDEVRTLSLTGYDSVGETLAWTLYLLARHPEVDAAVADEARAAGDGDAGPPELPYATAVVRESLRLFPPTWIFARVARGEDSLPSGARIPAGSKVYLCPYVVHRNPGYWPEPDRFAPARFAGGAANGRPRYAYFPFGGGSHVCIGEALAMAQVVSVLAGIASRHRLSVEPGRDVVPEAGLTLRPKRDLTMRVEPRACGKLAPR